MNQFIIVGEVKSMPAVKQTASNVNYAHLELEVIRGFRNAEGETESDLLTCTLWRGIADNCVDVCEVGSLVGIKGRIQANPYTTAENKTYINYEMVAEKVSFLTQKNPE